MAMTQIGMLWFTPDDIPLKPSDKDFSEGIILLMLNEETSKHFYTTGCYSFVNHKYLFDPVSGYDTFIAWAYFPSGKTIECSLLGGDTDES